MDGIIGIDKPAGLTSFDVVARLRRAAHQKKAGHTGTLDPDATGVLVVCLGAATRLASRLMDGRKSYCAQMFIGRSTVTGDSAGRVTAENKDFECGIEALKLAAHSFLGEIRQVPPMYSALKIGGRKLCDIAREGGEVDRAARNVTIHSIEVKIQNDAKSISYGDSVTLGIECSAGTYIRTLCEDIGKAIGTPAHMSALRRTYSSGLSIDDCISLEEAERRAREGSLEDSLIPISSALPGMQRVILSEFQSSRAETGGEFLAEGIPAPGEVMLLNTRGLPLAIAKAEPAPEGSCSMLIRPKVVFRFTEDGKDGDA